MKNITKKKIVLVTLSFLLGFSILIFTNYQGNLKPENQPTLKTPNLSQGREIYTIAQISGHLWSPDGTKVAYIKSPSGERWNCELWVADKNPLDAELINHVLISSEAEYDGLLDWQGDWILIRIRREEGEPASYYGRNELWRIRADGTVLSQVTFTYTNGIKWTENGFYINRDSAVWGKFIPGTNLVYFHAHDGNGWYKTFVCNADGTDSWYHISNPDYTWRPALSPTGNKLLWGQQSTFGQPTTHKSCNVDGSGRTTIKAFTNVISVTVLADGNTVIWSNNDNIYAIDMDGTNERTVLDDVYINRQWNYNPSDVQGLIMGSDRSDGNMYIYKINIDGTGIEQLTEGPYLDEFPILSPDGQYLSYLRLPFDFDKGSSTLPYPYELIVKSLYPVSQLKNYNMDPGYPYSWIDASGGTELFLGDDDYAAIALPFAFTFYDQTFSTIYVCSNGYLSFTDTIPMQNVNVPFPSADPTHNYMIAPFWDDLRPAAGGGSGNIYVQSFGTYWVAEWANIWHYSSGPTVGSFEVVLKNTGEIIFNYDYISYSGGGYTCGLNLGVDTDYYNSYQGLDDLTDDFSILFTYESFDHELSVSLDTPVNPEIGNSYLINATVNNYGLNEELDVDLLLYLDDVIVESTTISSLPVGASETISYMWIPPDYGAYNFTAYAPPVTDETFAGNNFITKIIQIVDSQLFDGMYIAHDFTDLGSSTNPSNILYTYNTDEFFNVAWDFTVNGDNWQVNSITREITGSYFFTDFTHTPMWIFPSVTLGDTVLISSIWDVDHTFEVRDELIYDLLDFGLIEIWVLQDLGDPSATAWYEKSTGILLNGTFYYTGGNNYVIFEFVDTNVQFSYITPDHDLSVSLEVPSSPDVGDIYIVNATVFNNGNNDEFNVDLFLYLDDVIVDSITISSLPIGASETINYMWIPPDYGIYNFTAHAPPVPDEPFITNNINTKLVSIFSPSKNYTMTAGVPYVWINASGGTELFLSDDGFATVDLPFDFTFYDQTFSTIYLGSNGYLSFTDSTPNDYTNDPIPSGDVDNYYLIAPFWDDLYPPSGGNIFVQSFDTYWVAAWVDIYHINGLVLGSFEVVLFDTGEILFNYDYLDYTTAGYTCGLNLGVDTDYYNSYQGLNDLTDDFSILFTYQQLTVTTPDSTSSWEISTTQSITWTSIGSISDVKIELYKGGVFVMEITPSTPNDGEFSWTIPSSLADSTLYHIKIIDAANPATDDYSDYFEIFTIPVVTDTITVTTPDTLTIWEMGTSQDITWTSTGTISDVKIELYKGGVFEMEIIASTTNNGTYNWDIPTDLEDGIDYQIKISDVSNSATYDESSNFAITSVDIPPAIPSYNLYIVIGIMCVISIILLKKRFKLIK